LSRPVELPQVGRRPACGDRSAWRGSAGHSHSCYRAAAWRMRRSVQARASGPYDLSGAPARVDKDHGFGSQLPGGLRPPPSKVPAGGFGRVRAECSRQRASEAIDPPARVTSRISGVAAELRGAEVARPAPSRPERPAIKLGVEGPDIEVLDTVPPVDVVHGGALAQRPAQLTAGIPARALRVPLVHFLVVTGSVRASVSVPHPLAGRWQSPSRRATTSAGLSPA
jgi:hypothetical protein